MIVLLVKPMHLPCRAEIDNTLEAMQRAVGGPIQAVYPFEEPVALICHEEGKLLNLPLNRKLRHPETGEVYDIIAGTFFLCSALSDSEEFASLSDEQLAYYRRKFGDGLDRCGVFSLPIHELRSLSERCEKLLQR